MLLPGFSRPLEKRPRGGIDYIMIDPTKTGASDMPARHWTDRWIPERAKPYGSLARLDRPIGTWLLYIPCLWGVVLASPGLAGPAWIAACFALFGAGALVMRGAGCTFNDIVDKDFDTQVARTRVRPIASGAISVPRAVAFLIAQMLVGLGILMAFNSFTIALGVASLALIFTYPFMKRITHWPQAFLGLTFNWGVLMGYGAITGTLAPAALVLYGASFCWTLGYDTIYAHQDKEDDALVGVKSLALHLGPRTRPWLFAFYGAAIALMALAGHLAGLHWLYYLGLACALAQLMWQAKEIDIDDAQDCLAKFKSNRTFGFILLAALAAGQLGI